MEEIKLAEWLRLNKESCRQNLIQKETTYYIEQITTELQTYYCGVNRYEKKLILDNHIIDDVLRQLGNYFKEEGFYVYTSKTQIILEW